MAASPYAPDTGKYEAARRGINDQYGGGTAVNAYGRFLGQQRGSRQLTDMSRGFERSYPGFGASFAPRGMTGNGINSGVMQRSMQNYVGDFQRDYARSQQDLTQSLQGYDLQQAQLDAWKQGQLADLELARSQEIANAAMNLEALRNYYGGQ